MALRYDQSNVKDSHVEISGHSRICYQLGPEARCVVTNLVLPEERSAHCLWLQEVSSPCLLEVSLLMENMGHTGSWGGASHTRTTDRGDFGLSSVSCLGV